MQPFTNEMRDNLNKGESEMKITWRTLAAWCCSALGVLGWCYVGGWMTVTRPVKGLIHAFMSGNLTVGKVLVAGMEGFIYLSLAGGIWCVGYVLSSHFKDM